MAMKTIRVSEPKFHGLQGEHWLIELLLQQELQLLQQEPKLQLLFVLLSVAPPTEPLLPSLLQLQLQS